MSKKQQEQQNQQDGKLDITEEDLKQLGLETMDEDEQDKSASDQPDGSTADSTTDSWTSGVSETTEQDQQQTEQPEQPETPETFEIIHNGQVYHVTKDKLIELAQKGFDYDYKVGKHSKIAQMIEADPEIARIVNDYWQRRVSGQPTQPLQQPSTIQGQQLQQQAQELDIQLKPLDEYESEVEWLKDNLTRIQSAIAPQIAQQVIQQIQPSLPQQAQPTDAQQLLRQKLAYHDPQNLDVVMPHLIDALTNKIPLSRFQAIDAGLVNNDPTELFKLYDEIKQQVLQGQQPANQQNQQSQQPQRQQKQAPFRAKPGSGQQKQSTASDKYEYVWNLPKEKFLQELEKLKGY